MNVNGHPRPHPSSLLFSACFPLGISATVKVVFVGGPYPAAVHEIEIVRDRGVLSLIREGEKILADGGFHGESSLLVLSEKQK